MSNKVEYNGKVYEIGKYYWFYDIDREVRFIDKLSGIREDDVWPFETEDAECYKLCDELSEKDKEQFGTIEDAPFKPEVGKLYQFSWNAKDWQTAVLANINRESRLEYEIVAGGAFEFCRPVPNDQRAEYGD